MKRLFIAITLAAASVAANAEDRLLNVSYDVSREFYADFNALFTQHWQDTTGNAVTIDQSHGASSKQTRSVIDGLEADVVTMNQQTDIDELAKRGLVREDWRDAFPNSAAPYSSTIVFLVRKGNPKSIQDWDDLVREDVQVIMPNPKTSGNGRFSYLAAWAYAARDDNDIAAQDFVKRMVGNVPVLETGGRGATTTFIQRGIGDVLLTFEAEILLITKVFNPDDFEVVVPSISIVADAPIAVVEPVTAKRGTGALAKAYLNYLYSPEAQQLAADNYFRPSDASVLEAHRNLFAPLELITVDAQFGGWASAQAAHFNDGGTFDAIYTGQ